jgi:3-oxoacyl-[acyl-carrier-protein] synthase-3
MSKSAALIPLMSSRVGRLSSNGNAPSSAIRFKNKRIAGIITILPSLEVSYLEEICNYNFSEKQSIKLGKIMGYGTRRIADNHTTVSDLCTYGLNYLFENNLLAKDSFQAMVLCTQSPDQFIPATSNIIAGNLNLSEDIICMDINQGCAGFEVGLLQAFMLLNTGSIDKVVLLNADILSKKVSERDRNSRPLVGDGASITIIENCNNGNGCLRKNHGFKALFQTLPRVQLRRCNSRAVSSK